MSGQSTKRLRRWERALLPPSVLLARAPVLAGPSVPPSLAAEALERTRACGFGCYLSKQ